MLGDLLYVSTGRGSGLRVLRSDGPGPRVETSFSDGGKLLGGDVTQMGTYVSDMRADGTLYGEGQGVIMGVNGEVASWIGQGIGTSTGCGGLRFRGSVYFKSPTPNWARLNSVAGVYEFEQDSAGNIKLQTREWK